MNKCIYVSTLRKKQTQNLFFSFHPLHTLIISILKQDVVQPFELSQKINTVQLDLLYNLRDLGSGVKPEHKVFKPLGPGCSKTLHLMGKRRIPRFGAIPA